MRVAARIPALALPIWLALLATGCRSGPAKGEPEDLLARGTEAYEAGDYAEATRQFRGVTVRHPESDQDEEASFRLAETYRARRKAQLAFDTYRGFANDYPNSRFGVGAAEGEFALGIDWIEGRMPGFLFFKPDPGGGVDVLEHMQLHYRNHRLADDALLRAALFRIEDGEYEAATIVLRRMLIDYPRSQHRMRARYELARSLYLLNQGPDYDERLLLQSRRGFRDFIGTAQLDGLAETLAGPIAAAERMIARIDERLGEHQYRVGRMYERIEAPDAAVSYYRYCLSEYPQTEAAEDCRRRLEKLGRLPAAPPSAAPAPEAG